MIAVNYFVLVFFKLLNFGVIIGLAWYLFKRYGLPTVQQGLIEYRAYFEGLATTHRSLQEEELMIEQQIIKDRKEQDLLKERLMRWLANVDDQNKKLIIEREERKKKIQELTSIQQKQITQHRIFSTIMPQALMEAYRTVRMAAKDESVHYKIFDRAISIMRRHEDQ